MTGRIKLLKDGEPLQEDENPAGSDADTLGYPDPEQDVLDDLTDPDLYLETDPIRTDSDWLNQMLFTFANEL